MLPRVLRWIFNALFALLTTRRVEGRENLPPQGPYILAVNHLSLFDVPFVYGLLGGEHMVGWAAEKYERHPLFGPILRAGGGIFIQRGKVDRRALLAGMEALRRGKVFGLAPEGTRSPTGALIRGKVGVAYLAHQADVPVVPAAIIGTERLGRDLLRLRRPRLTLRIGKPFRLPPLQTDKPTAAMLRRDVDEIMCRIAALLPPEYRGVYADHPRLQALLQGEQAAEVEGAMAGDA